MNMPLKNRVRTQPPSAAPTDSAAPTGGIRTCAAGSHGSQATGKKVPASGRSTTAKSQGSSHDAATAAGAASKPATSMVTRS
ncbi:MAG: hypothetical protein R3F59_03805 [Myxococcota bacterium]